MEDLTIDQLRFKKELNKSRIELLRDQIYKNEQQRRHLEIANEIYAKQAGDLLYENQEIDDEIEEMLTNHK